MAAADYRLMTEATGQRIATALENLAGFGSYLTTADVVNNLTSTSTTAPLSAAQGKALNDLATKNVLGAAVSLNSYTSSPYTFPSDGFLSCSCASASAAKALCQVYGSDGSQLFRLGGWGNGTYGT